MQLTNLNRVYTAIQAECCHSLLQIQSEPEQGKSPSANIIIECVPGSGIVLNHFFLVVPHGKWNLSSLIRDQTHTPFTGSTGPLGVACHFLDAAAS